MNKSAQSYHVSFIHKDDDETAKEVQSIVDSLKEQLNDLIQTNRNIESVWVNFDDLHTAYLDECIENGEI